jgi:hypothetical protein
LCGRAGAPLPAVQEDECKNTLSPATGQGIAELILRRHFQTLELTRLGWKRIAENRPFPEQGIF